MPVGHHVWLLALRKGLGRQAVELRRAPQVLMGWPVISLGINLGFQQTSQFQTTWPADRHSAERPFRRYFTKQLHRLRQRLETRTAPSPTPTPPPERERGRHSIARGKVPASKMGEHRHHQRAAASVGGSTPLSLDQEIQLGVASWSRGPPEPPAWHNQDRKGVHGGTGLYAYSITTKTKPKGKAWRPAAGIKMSNPLGRPTRGPPPAQLSGAAYQQRPDSLGISSQYGRPASSVYSQPSPEAAVFAAQQLRQEHGYYPQNPLEVSPPSSPDIVGPRHRNARDVSPIDEPDDMAQATANGYSAPPQRGAEARSNIPSMRRERRKNSDAARQALRERASQERMHQPQQRPHDHNVRWDPRTGEPTSTDKGRKSQVNPQAYASDLTRREVNATPPRPGQPVQQSSSPYGPRVTRRAPSATPEPERQTPPRPAWQGGSGRMVLAEPLQDSDNAPPLAVSPRNRPPPLGYASASARGGNRVLSPVQSMGSSGRSTPTASAQAQSAHYPSPPPEARQAPPVRSMPSKEQQAAPPQTQQPQLRPSAPQPQAYAPDVRDSLNVPSTEKAIRRKPAGGAGHHAQPSWSSSVYSVPSQPQTPVIAAPTRPQQEQRATQPDAPSAPATAARIEPDAQPLQSQPAGPSVLDRKRPIVAGYEGQGPRSPPVDTVVRIDMSSPYQREPASAGVKSATNKPLKKAGLFSSGANDSVTSLSSEFKSLPPAPPEDAAKDRVAQLNAKLSALGNRRINLNTAIKQMTELMPTDNVLASEAVVRKREAEKRKVEALKLELAEVDRESYEIGLKLHRAYKRLDRDAEYEPTTLWVRRVTG
ncbi:uncharacterized protein B0I36DRAFT_347053 [Microdochium trichocladiopsis]|uniref:Uncharacterized protein n=1 Tax=Microdochium trichocladiopsis TaxID=1682393 RepID=A0A9P9BSV6_9PEZI|nr:uncharacterized protein B0I36DRAFT_347053 [Microdochium trichocladiopsis]KAH7035250.1 hypothetical protein B0I36DRAFT_347053 [Microdochium trichocladiopsis]